jgi:hypothetical protein
MGPGLCRVTSENHPSTHSAEQEKAAFAAQALWRFSENEAGWPAFASTNVA